MLPGCGGGGDAAATASAQGDAPTVEALAASDTALAADAATTWTTVATEGQSFTVSGTQTVRFGAGTAWITMQVTGTGSCTNVAFGKDPAYGVVKSCQVASTDTAPTWTQVAVENASFTVTGTQSVRYGAVSSWVTKSVTASGVCSNAFFGVDPLPGTRKTCQVAAGAATPTPTPTPVAGVCTVPSSAADTSANTATVGNGTAASCTEAALRAAVNAYPVVKFSCGASPVTIPIAAQIEVPPQRNTVIDGGGKVTLDGQNKTRILNMAQANYRTNSLGLTLQHIALVNGRAPAGGYVAPSASNPSCAYGYATGSGAAVYVSDARLYVFDVDFRNNTAATPGPDVGGGAIYAAGSLDVLVAGSRFSGNTGSNSGAVGMLNSNFRLYNSTFSGNSATGVGENYKTAAVASCPGVGHQGQGGAGGNGGALGIDGGSDGDVTICGSTFTGNKANELAGAFGRTADIAAHAMTIDRVTASNNTAKKGGVFFLHNLSPLVIKASTFSGNSAVLFGVGQLDQTSFTIVNSTFANNQATLGLAGALFFGGSSSASVIQNSTFAGNLANGGPGYFSAAIFGDSNFSINNTVFANNTTKDPYNPMQCGFQATAGANDMQWPAIRSTGGLADTACVSGISFVNPALGALADNGGPTQTLLPAASSPLKGKGRNCPTTDQRGNVRSAASCTVGAVE